MTRIETEKVSTVDPSAKIGPRPLGVQPRPALRRLIINADDFGRSPSANAAIIRAHREGVLTTASLMVNEAGFEEAVALAQANPSLGVGLHLTLLCGHSALAPDEIPGLVNGCREFGDNAVAVGWRYFFDHGLRGQLEAEIGAQFRKFRATGLPLDHLNGHLHVHLHPIVFRILMQHAREWGITHTRLTFDPFWLNRRLSSGRWLYRLAHAAIYHWLSFRVRGELRRRQIKHTARVFGLLQNAQVDETFVLKLLPALPGGDSELYSHPSLDQSRHELDALLSSRVKAQVQQLGIQLIRYQDL
jgi:hopanoid biosynthesis associated protein HpnK